ncbi:YdcH family protein [Oceanimonas baumannii]|uniref:YdcH family protein n=1 Tax=Oceanimonas baumannii TaxID=129578 RepID=UPI001D17EBE6|nr:YdcH family protein [Oceanimonas baumannii]MCC4266035.1 YdcH family protein [Oceanimonas baumannii]
MTHTLAEEFPEQASRITELKLSDEAFARLAREYHKLNHEIEGLEACNQPIADADFESLKLRRHQLKEQIYKGWFNGQG